MFFFFLFRELILRAHCRKIFIKNIQLSIEIYLTAGPLWEEGKRRLRMREGTVRQEQKKFPKGGIGILVIPYYA